MAPLELAWETSACPPRAGVGDSTETRGHCRLLCASYLGSTAKRLEGPLAMARTAMFCRIPVPRAGTSPLPGPGPEQRPRGLDSGGADRLCYRGGLQPRCAQISPRARVPQGAAAGVSVGLSRSRRAVVEGEETASSGQEGDGHWDVTGPLVTGRVTLWLLGRERRPKLRLPASPSPLASHKISLSPSQKSAQHLGILQSRAASACLALQGF